MADPLALTLGQQFELERLTRVIDATADVAGLRGLAKQLLQAWQTQKAATEWVMRQQLGAPSQLAAAARRQGLGSAASPQPQRSDWDLVL